MPAKLTLTLTRGFVRDRILRRKMMFTLLLLAMLLLFAGAVLLDAYLRTHPLLFILYWLACAWLTFSAVLLAIYDILQIRAQASAERKQIVREVLSPETGQLATPPTHDSHAQAARGN